MCKITAQLHKLKENQSTTPSKLSLGMTSYSTTKEDATPIYPMPQDQLLGFDKDGNIFIEDWLDNLSLHFSGIYGRMAECFQDLIPRPYHDAKAKFVHKDEDGVDIPVPTEAKDFIGHNTVKGLMNTFLADQLNWKNVSPKMCTNLIRRALAKESQERLLDIKKEEVKAARKLGDVLTIVNLAIEIHTYRGDVFDDEDIRKAKAEFLKFGTSQFNRNWTLKCHKDVYLRIRQTLKIFKLLDDGKSIPRRN